jgi:hypothetical protein
MRVRKMSALVGAALILGGYLVLHMMMELAVFLHDVHDVGTCSDSVIYKGHIGHVELCEMFMVQICI